MIWRMRTSLDTFASLENWTPGHSNSCRQGPSNERTKAPEAGGDQQEGEKASSRCCRIMTRMG